MNSWEIILWISRQSKNCSDAHEEGNRNTNCFFASLMYHISLLALLALVSYWSEKRCVVWGTGPTWRVELPGLCKDEICARNDRNFKVLQIWHYNLLEHWHQALLINPIQPRKQIELQEESLRSIVKKLDLKDPIQAETSAQAMRQGLDFLEFFENLRWGIAKNLLV